MFKIEDLSLSLGKFNLKDINLNIEDGEYFIILGPSGSGKTVLLETIAGRYKPTCGDIYYNDKTIKNLLVEERNIGFVYQNYELFPHMTARENIVFGLKIKKKDREEISSKLDYLVGILNIEEILERYPKNLSGGEKQRVALARALIISPSILLLDEPFSALDMNIKIILQKEMKKIHSKFGATIIHVTHDIEEAIYLGDKIGIMKEGSLRVVDDLKRLEDEEVFLREYFKTQRERWSNDGALYRFME